MQSGISASKELHTAFKDLLSNTNRGLVVGISNEALVPKDSVPSTSTSFSSDLSNLQPLIADNAAAYIILKQDTKDRTGGAGGYVAITYVPNEAPVRQKMLFAASRLTLVRDLGTEHFTESVFATTKAELTAAGWSKHEAHTALSAPLTEEEQGLQGIRAAEAQESRGTSARSGGHVSSSVALPIDDDALAALNRIATGAESVVQLAIDISSEKLTLASSTAASTSPSDLAGAISPKSPRYTFYHHAPTSSVLFIYTCPTSSSIKERMLYASSRARTIELATKDAGVVVAKRMEATDPADITEEAVLAELQPAGTSEPVAGSGGDSKGFARPKRPGRK